MPQITCKVIDVFFTLPLKHRRQTSHGIHLRQYLSLLLTAPTGPGFYRHVRKCHRIPHHSLGEKNTSYSELAVRSIYSALILHCADTQCGIFEPNSKTFPLQNRLSHSVCAAVNGPTDPFNNSLVSSAHQNYFLGHRSDFSSKPVSKLCFNAKILFYPFSSWPPPASRFKGSAWEFPTELPHPSLLPCILAQKQSHWSPGVLNKARAWESALPQCKLQSQSPRFWPPHTPWLTVSQ